MYSQMRQGKRANEREKEVDIREEEKEKIGEMWKRNGYLDNSRIRTPNPTDLCVYNSATSHPVPCPSNGVPNSTDP